MVVHTEEPLSLLKILYSDPIHSTPDKSKTTLLIIWYPFRLDYLKIYLKVKSLAGCLDFYTSLYMYSEIRDGLLKHISFLGFLLVLNVVPSSQYLHFDGTIPAVLLIIRVQLLKHPTTFKPSIHSGRLYLQYLFNLCGTANIQNNCRGHAARRWHKFTCWTRLDTVIMEYQNIHMDWNAIQQSNLSS